MKTQPKPHPRLRRQSATRAAKLSHLAQKLPGNKLLVDEQLEALDLADRLEHRQVDIGPKLQEARLGKGFKASRAGTLWTIRLEGNSQPATAAQAGQPSMAQAALPPEMASLLNQLNMT